jgi:hypothetical protein
VSRDIDSRDDEREAEPTGPGRSGHSASTPTSSAAADAPLHDGRGGPSDPRDRSDHPANTLDRVLSRGHDREERVVWRDRVVTLSPSESGTLRTLGAFRTVALTDLARHHYGGSRGQCDRDLRRLQRHRFIEARTLPAPRGGRGTPVITLTREGHAFTHRYLAVEGQRTHWGLVRPKEQAHDAALYRMAIAETERLAKRGATVRRVILDAELKGQLAAARYTSGSPADTASRTLSAAADLHLSVVDGRVQIPDLRLEYETREGTIARVDLELATEHYRPDQVAAKVQAGFTIYAPASQTERLSSALHDRGIVAEILSL